MIKDVSQVPHIGEVVATRIICTIRLPVKSEY